VKHDLSDPHAQENEHLDQEGVQGLEHMVVADHGPKKGMAPQFNPLFFPFATCLPTFSIPQNYDLKEGCNITLKAHFQMSPMGMKSNDNQDKLELNHHESSTTNTTDPIQSELMSPWPDQWRLRGLDKDMINHKHPWPNLEGTNAWDKNSDAKELDLTNDAPYATPWGLLEEPCWISELSKAIEPEPEEAPFPLTLHYPDRDMESKLEEELSPQTLDNGAYQKETLSPQNNPQTHNAQHNQECQNERNPEYQVTGSTSDNEEGTTKTNHHLTHQELKCPALDDKERTVSIKLTLQEVKVLLWSDDNLAIENDTREQELHHIHELIKHPDMTQQWMTRPQNDGGQPELEQAMMPQLQTSTHYPKMSKQNN